MLRVPKIPLSFPCQICRLNLLSLCQKPGRPLLFPKLICFFHISSLLFVELFPLVLPLSNQIIDFDLVQWGRYEWTLRSSNAVRDVCLSNRSNSGADINIRQWILPAIICLHHRRFHWIRCWGSFNDFDVICSDGLSRIHFKYNGIISVQQNLGLWNY